MRLVLCALPLAAIGGLPAAAGRSLSRKRPRTPKPTMDDACYTALPTASPLPSGTSAPWSRAFAECVAEIYYKKARWDYQAAKEDAAAGSAAAAKAAEEFGEADEAYAKQLLE